MTTIPPEQPPNHLDEVRALIADLQAIRARITGFEHDRKGERSRLNLNASVSDRFLESCARAIEDSPALASASQITPAELRETIAYTQAYLSLADELELYFRGLRFTIADRRASVSQRAQQTYTLAKTLNRHTDREVLVPHIEMMKRSLKRKRKAQQVELPLLPVEPPAVTPPPIAPVPLLRGAA